ncbi:hypothetical protein [Bacillus thuringiensis]|uniref:hypothetical protein n=1 Tax=Bacillus thuringiensis TaxID=1428 RepID=UPI000BF79D46|nr:hypothetical protein [Bacillus thuringiensis]PFA41961.1 hypothetical protein CN416_04210 [Bacillus thuringiensis]
MKLVTFTHLRSDSAITVNIEDIITIREKDENTLIVLKNDKGFYIKEHHDVVVNTIQSITD